jgi:phosphoribosyl-AMP cyclohydrolase
MFIKMAKEYTNELMLDFGPDGNEIIPVITQDFKTREVLILAYTNKNAFNESMHTGYATYYSRTRQSLWKKGETSGDLLKINEIRINCEQNSLLFLVTPEGKGVCHAKKSNGFPYSTCYYRCIQPDGKLRFIEE